MAAEAELVLDSASVQLFFQPGNAEATEFWVNFNAMRDFHITCSEFIRRRHAPAIHVISKQDHWYRGRDMAAVIAFINEATRASGLRTILLGNSMGGFGVLLHSAELHSDLVIASGPQIVVDHDRSIGHDDRYRPEWAAMEAGDYHPWRDATLRLARDKPLRVLYDPHAPEDAWHARFLRGIANVEFYRAPFAGHETLLELARAHLWVPAMEAMIDGDYPAFARLLPAFRAHRIERFPYHLTMGDRHYRRGRLDHAVRHFRRVVEIRPSYVEGHQYLAIALRDAGDMAGAIDALEYATGHLGGDDRFWWIFQGLANLNFEAGQLDAARHALLRGKAMFPLRAEIEAEQARFRLHLAQGAADLSAAAKHAAQAVAMDPAEPDHRRLVSRIYAQRARFIAERGRGATVLGALEHIAAGDAADVDVHHQLSRIYERDGRIDDAMAILDPIRPADTTDPERRWVLHRVANLHAARGELAAAATMLTELVALGPSPHLILDLADVRERAGDRAAAITALREASERSPANEEGRWLLHRLAGMLVRAGDLAGAEAALVEAAARCPGDPAALIELARFKMQRPVPDFAAASRLLRRLVAQVPAEPEYRALLKQSELRRARRLVERGRPRVAARMLQAVLEADPDDLPLHLELALAREASGDRAGAIVALRTFIDRVEPQPDGWCILHQLVRLHAADGDLVTAEKVLEEAAARFPDAFATHLELGKFRLYKPHPAPAPAARSLRRAIALAPDGDEYRTLLRQADTKRAERLAAGGRMVAAAALYGRMIEANLADPPLYILRADALIAAGRGDEARAVYRHAAEHVRADPAGWWPYHRIAALHAATGDLHAFEAALEEAAAAFPDQTVPLTELGKFKLEKAEPDAAAAARLFTRALGLEPGDERVRALLQRACEAVRREHPWRSAAASLWSRVAGRYADRTAFPEGTPR